MERKMLNSINFKNNLKNYKLITNLTLLIKLTNFLRKKN